MAVMCVVLTEVPRDSRRRDVKKLGMCTCVREAMRLTKKISERKNVCRDRYGVHTYLIHYFQVFEWTLPTYLVIPKIHVRNYKRSCLTNQCPPIKVLTLLSYMIYRLSCMAHPRVVTYFTACLYLTLLDSTCIA